MINKHKAQTVEITKSTSSKPKNDYTPAGNYNVEESDEEETAQVDNDLFSNNNLQEAQAREKGIREKLAEVNNLNYSFF